MTVAPRLIAVSFALLLLVGGCGHDTYEQRMEETRKYFAYLDRLNMYLDHSLWKGQNVDLKVPNQFKLIPAPAKAKGEETAPDKDPRQPPFAESPIPGLQGSWKADLALSGNEGRGVGYLYVFSNFEALGQKGGEEKAAEFNTALLKTIATDVGQPVPEVGKIVSHTVPKNLSDAYVEQRTFKMLQPPIPANLNDKPYRIQVYSYQKEKSPAQISIVLVLPENTSPNEKLERAMDLCLETFEITLEKPVKMPGQGPAGKGSGV